MSASATATGLDSSGMSSSVPAWLRTKALKARYSASKVWVNCLNGVEGDPLISGNIKKMGDRITFQIFPTLATNDISTTDGSYTATEIVLTQGTITINKWKSVAADIVDIVDAQSALDYDAEFAEAFGKAIGQKQDDDVLALVASLTTNVAGDANAFSDAKVLLAQRQLDDLEVPKDDRTWVLAPVAHADLLQVDKFTLANTTGFSKGVQVDSGRIVGLYGTKVVVSTRVTTTSSKRDNVLFHKEAFGVAMQREFKMEKFMRQQFSTPYAGSALYGVATLRDNHASFVQSAA
jgi:hypothetical protein